MDDVRAEGPIDVVDLFCGCGGLSAGFETVGRLTRSFRLTAAFDIDRAAMQTYAANLPISPVALDLSEVVRTEASLASWAKSLDRRVGNPLVLIGGPPCQGFSAHRKSRADEGDDRNSLVRTFAEIAAYLKPDFVVMENVPELLSERHWHQFLYLRQTLADLGFFVRAQVQNLAGFGVPQQRFRAITMASRSPFAPIPSILNGNELVTVRQEIGWLGPVAAGVQHPDDAMHVSAGHRASTVAVIERIPKDGGRRPKGLGPSCLDRVDGFRDVYGRLYWDRPSNTITAYARNPASGRFVHPEQSRGLTVREASLLQGFPSRYIFRGSFDGMFSQIGNAVPPRFSTLLAAHVFDQLSGPVQSQTAYHETEIHKAVNNLFSSTLSFRKRVSARA